jgi:hypothetical protein
MVISPLIRRRGPSGRPEEGLRKQNGGAGRGYSLRVVVIRANTNANVNVNVQAVAACGPCLSLTPSHSSANLHRRLSETRCPSHVRLARCGVPACWDTDPEGRCASASSSDLNLSSFRRPVVAPTSVDVLLCRHLWRCRVLS